MNIDPFVFAAFGPPPKDIDLSANSEAMNAGVVLTLLCVSAAFLAVRIAMKTIHVYGLSVDDYVLLVSFVFVTLTAAMVVVGGYSGVGKHVWALTSNKVEQVLKLTYVYTFMYVGAVFTTKVSILLFYRRIFNRGGLYFQLAFWFGAFLVGAYPVIFVLTMSLGCSPVSFFWTQVKGTQGKCIDVGYFFVILAITNLITTVIVLLIPVPEVLKLQMSKGKKAALIGVLALGGLVCIASGVRIHYLNVFANALDPTWHMGPVAIWSSVEPSVGIVSACLPSLKSLLRHLRGKSSSRASNQVENSAAKGNNKPRYDDEIALRSHIIGGEGSMRSGNGSDRDRHIFVKTSVEQTFHEMA
ncbi:hypothetical protein NW768_007438 [Fusarium equiseti]|uniref:Rhodopsin domain-containing protein n=1 Tax=Fusarium equiseti TaxID=61235 RepID=A0ABQ8R7H1_FUSEQ|nr:hypothetical protein NW768_007438 [Fusarium equiseti]